MKPACQVAGPKKPQAKKNNQAAGNPEASNPPKTGPGE